MTHPASSQDWQSVDGLDDFVAYLRLLSADTEVAEQSTGQWRNTTIPDFLAAIDDLLGLAQDQAAHKNPAFAKPTMSTWWQLAVLLHTATTQPPAAQADTTNKHADAKTVQSLESFRAYLQWLIEDFRLNAAEVAERTRTNKWDNQGRWAHGTLSTWLERWAAWLQDCYLKPLPALMVELGIQREPVEPMSWRSIAIQLSGARIYE